MSTDTTRPIRILPQLSNTPMVIREAGHADREALLHLAQRDSSEPLEGQVVVAELDGEPQAAISVDSSRTIADPFQRTMELVAMLRLRAEQLRSERRRPLRLVARTPLAGRTSRRTAAAA